MYFKLNLTFLLQLFCFTIYFFSVNFDKLFCYLHIFINSLFYKHIRTVLKKWIKFQHSHILIMHKDSKDSRSSLSKDEAIKLINEIHNTID